MAGRRLVDAAKLFQASKSIAAKHINLRFQQLDLYTQTSSLAKAVKEQTDRFTLTAQAAITLARRLNQDAQRNPPEATSQPTEPHRTERREDNTTAVEPGKDELSIRQKKAVSKPLPDGTIPSGGVEQDGSSKKASLDEQALSNGARRGVDAQLPKPDSATVSDASNTSGLSAEEARNLQRQFEAQIPSSEETVQPPPINVQAEQLAEGHDRDVFYLRSKESQPEPSSLPRTKIPKHTEDRQENDDHVKDEKINQDVYYATPEPLQGQPGMVDIPHKVADPEQDQLPEGINTDVFRTKRVAKMLGGNPYRQGNPYAQEPDLHLRGAAETPQEHTKLSEGRAQDTFNVHVSEQPKPSDPDMSQTRMQSTTESEIRDFASELAKDAEAAASPVSEVRVRLA
jgi:aarF domain-containing kinase